MSARAQSNRKTSKGIVHKRTFLIAIIISIAIPTILFAYLSVNLAMSLTQGNSVGQIPPEIYTQYGMALLGAGLAVAGSCLGAGIAISGAASAGIAAIVERPETSIWVLILAGLGEGVAIYGLLIAILIMSKLPPV